MSAKTLLKGNNWYLNYYLNPIKNCLFRGKYIIAIRFCRLELMVINL